MGIIIKQSIKGSIWSYLGVIIGFVTTSYLYPNYLTTDIVGLFGLLVSYSTLFGQFSLLGIQGITSRVFPVFRDKESNHHGFFFISLIFFLSGLALFLIFFFSFAPWLVENNQEKSKLFADHLYLLIPMTLFTMIFVQLDTYNKMLYDSVSGVFLQEFMQRGLIFLITVFFALNWISLNQMIWAYAAIVCAKAVVMVIILAKKKELNFQIDRNFVTPKLRKEIIDVGLFSIVTGLGSMIIFNIDKIVINQMLDLSNTGVYTIAFYFGTLVVIPSRSILKISGALIADGWAAMDIDKIKEIYYKSCINQFIIGTFLFVGIWSNIDNILTILGPDYSESKWVIFFVGLGYLFDMLTGANGQVIAYSRYYRIALVFVVSLVVVAVALLYLLIPVWGITGAAIAIACSFLFNNLLRYLFLFRKYRMQPFNFKFLIVLAVFLVVYFVVNLIPQQNLLIDILVRSTVITVVSFLALYYLPISEDIRKTIDQLISYLKLKEK